MYVFPHTGHVLYFLIFLYTWNMLLLFPISMTTIFVFVSELLFFFWLPWNWVDLYYVCRFVCIYYLFCSLLLLLNVYSLYNIIRLIFYWIYSFFFAKILNYFPVVLLQFNWKLFIRIFSWSKNIFCFAWSGK